MDASALHKQRILITGASRGLGRTIAEVCVRGGANVVITGRGGQALTRAWETLASQAQENQKILMFPARLDETADMDALLSFAISELGHLDGLVNNAGMTGPMGPLEENDWAGLCQTLQVNLLAAIYLCRGVIPMFRRRRHGRIVNLSGGGATAPMPRFSAYAVSKAALVRFTENLAEELKDTGITVNAVAPGALKTDLLENVVAAGPEQIGQQYYERMCKVMEDGGSSLEEAAELCAFLLSPASAVTGRLISAVWDPWRTLPDNQEKLAGTDIYTLRRIVPSDRGMDL